MDGGRREAAVAVDPARDRRRPLVFAMVFGVFLVLAAITATAHVVVVSHGTRSLR